MHKQIGLYGLGVMGQSLARNIANKGFSISVFNIETDVTKACCQKYPLLHGYENIADFVDSLEKPRKDVYKRQIYTTERAGMIKFMKQGVLIKGL